MYDPDEDDEEIEPFVADLFDPSDVVWDMPKTKSRRKVMLTATSETDFCLMKLYLALVALTEKIEEEMGIMESSGEH